MCAEGTNYSDLAVPGRYKILSAVGTHRTLLKRCYSTVLLTDMIDICFSALLLVIPKGMTLIHTTGEGTKQQTLNEVSIENPQNSFPTSIHGQRLIVIMYYRSVAVGERRRSGDW